MTRIAGALVDGGGGGGGGVVVVVVVGVLVLVSHFAFHYTPYLYVILIRANSAMTNVTSMMICS